jgi:NAD-dependent deacetylase
MMDDNIWAVADLLRNAQYAVALTGAGISTPSGIPDFRSPNCGLWDTVSPQDVATLFSFRTKPQAFYDWIRPLAATMMNAQPNPAHLALSRMEQLGRLHCLITQNIDMLHTRAGSRSVVEVHGHMREMTCIACYQVYEAGRFIAPFLVTGEIPRCPQCAGVLKPNVILFGEQLPVKELQAARRAAARCNVMLIAGSSLEVAPACDLPVLAHAQGASVILVNRDPTPVDYLAQIIIRDDVAVVLPQIADSLEDS